MLIGAHVSPAGGLHRAIERGEDLGAQAIQIFNQSPRAWRPTAYGPDDFAAFAQARRDSPVGAVLIHAVYLLNCASEDPEIASKSLAALTQALRLGAAIGADAVVVHPGSAKAGSVERAIQRAGKTMSEALAESEGCALHLENTAGAGGTLGRSFEELARLIEAAGAHPRLGLCLDSCHLLASGFEVRTTEALAEVLDECVARVGLERLGSVHFNDSQTPLGSNRDRHANVGEGELGREGSAVFLSEPRFEGLPCVLETPGVQRRGPSREQVDLARTLRAEGLARRGN
ncbi:MAG TPA: deoxyribonuclease IV [Solirubrobacteraceae bacterium]|jgi:deoxyribonuclease-4|nr:deoxyribonuclease IV [Solirubrobacteraceae bacterium]